ncbi:hypothetical protein CGQ24_09930 [Arthrobacter sp. 7749]|nr:hypothetical protein CGQ24_09930 [Arthrobacter sp. 7749]
MGSHRWADLVARGRSNSVPGVGLLADFLRAVLARRPKDEAEPAPGPMDLRGGWSLLGAWISASAGVRLGQAQLILWALGLWLVAGIGVLLLLRRRHGRIGESATPSFAGLALGCGAAAIVCTQLLLSGVGLINPALEAAAHNGSTVRIQLELASAPSTSTVTNRFTPGEPAHTQFTADARTVAVSSDGRWVRAAVPVWLSFAESKAPSGELSTGSTVELLATVSSSEPGDRQQYWINAAAPLKVVGVNAAPSVFKHMRERFTDSSTALPHPARALLPGMVFGDRSPMDQELSTAMKVAGLSHLSAVSGANCALVLGFVLALSRAAGLGRAATLLLGLAALLGFVFLVGNEPSVLRAAVMGSIAAVGVHANRGRNALATLGLAVLVLLTIDPWLAGEPAFQLSTMATAGIVLMGRRMAQRLNRWLPAFLAEGTAVSVAAQIACLPVLVTLNPSFSLYSVPANLLVAPLIPLITVAGTLGVVVLIPVPVLGVALIWVAGMPTMVVGLLGTWISELPGALRPWPVGLAGILLAWGIVVGALTALGYVPPTAVHWRSRILLAVQSVVTGVLLGLVLPLTALVPVPVITDWIIAACDVGQGDGMVLNAGAAGAVVVDTGKEPEAMNACLKRLQVKNVAALFISHRHADHDGGIAGVAAGRTVGSFFYSVADDPADPPHLADTSGQQKTATQLGSGATGKAGTVSWNVLGPIPGGINTGENDASLVIRFEIQVSGSDRRVSLLATGDMQEEAMDQLIAQGTITHADILKVSHHGAANGGIHTAPTVRPVLALVSVGKDNTYGHPSDTALRALEVNNVRVMRTDLSGTIIVSWGDRGLSVSSLGPSTTQ